MRIQVTAGVLAVLVLAACDSGGSAVETRERAAVEPVALSSTTTPDGVWRGLWTI